ncbi:Uncharacterized protein Rs2_29196 [Raphanus sativus]|nr:Uncharacterized protein Rs2_29196 [Raphanus sativus]
MGESRNGEGTRKRLKISVPHFDNSALIKSCSRMLIGRCMNPGKQEIKALLTKLPKIWNLEDKVVGTDLGLGKFQFEFEKEEDIEGVLKHQPYHFDYWMIALGKWQPKKSLHYPSEIHFWVRVLGVSKEYRTVTTFESIGGAIGEVIEVDLDQMRVLVVVDAFKELCFETSVDFKGGEFYDGEEVPILLRYERLFGYCENCGSLCHNEANCPTGKGAQQSQVKQTENRVGNGGWHDAGTHDERARSYKGVVINGNGGYQNREREPRDYYGKGKMVEEAGSQWVRVADKGGKRGSGYKGSHRGEGEMTRHKTERRENQRPQDQTSNGSGRAGEQQNQVRLQEDTREEGEITTVGDDHLMPPSKGFQAQLEETQAMGTEMVSDPIDAEKGIQHLQGLMANQATLGDDDVMDWDEIRASCKAQGLDLDTADDLPDLSEEEIAEMNLLLEPEAKGTKTEELQVQAEGKGPLLEEEAKKQSTKKRLFKPPTNTAVSNKLRIAKALASPRKRAPAKLGTRAGDNKNPMESQVASNLPPDNSKN